MEVEVEVAAVDVAVVTIQMIQEEPGAALAEEDRQLQMAAPITLR